MLNKHGQQPGGNAGYFRRLFKDVTGYQMAASRVRWQLESFLNNSHGKGGCKGVGDYINFPIIIHHLLYNVKIYLQC